ncbi:MAG: sulfite exporter TauE/SafE family protein, partial [Comamonadaceae bacterium]
MPVPTLWCTLRGMERDAQRSVVQNFNLSMLAVAFALHVGTGN